MTKKLIAPATPEPDKSPQPDPQPYKDPVKDPPFDPPDQRPLVDPQPPGTDRPRMGSVTTGLGGSKPSVFPMSTVQWFPAMGHYECAMTGTQSSLLRFTYIPQQRDSTRSGERDGSRACKRRDRQS